LDLHQKGGGGVSIVGAVSESRLARTGTGPRTVCTEDAPATQGAPVFSFTCLIQNPKSAM
jgi:hypothetical protein